jgi:chemotaxis signal transduction protein
MTILDDPERYELMTRLVRLERELLFVRRKLKDREIPSSLPQGSFQAVRVRVGVGEYAIPSICVRQIIRYAPPAPLKLAPCAVKGVLSIGGGPIVVVDLGERLGYGATPLDRETALVIASIGDCLLALIIERVIDAVLLDSAELHVPSVQLAPNACVAAVGTYAGRLVQVLDLDRLLCASELELVALGLESR